MPAFWVVERTRDRRFPYRITMVRLDGAAAAEPPVRSEGDARG